MDREGGNKERMRKCREWISLHFLILSPFLPSLALRLQRVAQPCWLLKKMPLVSESVQRGPFWLYMKDIRNLLLPLRIKMKSGFLWDSDQDVLSSEEAGADLQDSPVHHHPSLPPCHAIAHAFYVAIWRLHRCGVLAVILFVGAVEGTIRIRWVIMKIGLWLPCYWRVTPDRKERREEREV